MVPSSPNGPCSMGRTTSTSPSSPGMAPGSAVVSAPGSGWEPAVQGMTCPPGSATASTDGSCPPVMASRSGSSAVSTHRPSGRMPIGTTS